MDVGAKELSQENVYKLLVGIVVPRPIAWVTTLSEQGQVNLAPFSCYTFVCSDPPILAINIGRRGGAMKDTARNIARAQEFVVNVVQEEAIGPMHASSAECPADVSETQALGLPTCPSVQVRPPRLDCSPINLECKLERIIELGRQRNNLILGEVVQFRIRDDIIRDGKIDVTRLRPLARLGGPHYASLGEVMTMAPAALGAFAK
jgi:flavin reductase (DIM6/NTAB) family NADH-FMN oxidoreductase RutF